MARLQPFSRSIELLVSKSLSPEAQSKAIAKVHRNAVAEAETHNARVLGGVPPSETFVDGRKSAPLESVNPDGGIILTRFDTIGEVVDYIWELLIQNSPVLTGAYRDSHRLFADGVEVDQPDPSIVAKEWLFVSNLPYSRKIERGQGSAPDEGVYEGAAALAKGRFGNLVNIRFTFQSIVEGGLMAYQAVPRGDLTRDRKGRFLASSRDRTAQKLEREHRYPAIRISLR